VALGGEDGLSIRIPALTAVSQGAGEKKVAWGGFNILAAEFTVDLSWDARFPVNLEQSRR
jgi:hypothetical protein